MPALLTLVIAAAVWFFYSHGWVLWYGDSEAHLNTARRIFDSQTPGYDQIGTPWLPLPHILLLPFVRVDRWWHSGIAAAMPSAICFVAGGVFLFAAARRIFESMAAALAATALVSLNPNLLYLSTSAMTEPVFYAALMAILYFSVRFRKSQGWGSVAGAGIAACAAALTRYDGWFLIPFAGVYFLWAARRRPIATAFFFCLLASAGPVYWLANNWYLTGDALDFYRGPYSPRAIQAGHPYPGRGDWHTAWYYYRHAAQLCAGPGLALMGVAGTVAALIRRRVWPIALLALPGVFYISSLHSGSTPIFVPALWPHSYYNTRYGLAVLPLLALASAALVVAVPPSARTIAALAVVLAGSAPWLVNPRPEAWVTWAESRANSEGRRAWMQEAADYLRPRFRPGSGILTSPGDDFSGIYRVMGIPLAETFGISNGLPWLATLARPDLFLWQDWVVAKRGDPVDDAVHRAAGYGIHYSLQLTIVKKDEPVVLIYRR